MLTGLWHLVQNNCCAVIKRQYYEYQRLLNNRCAINTPGSVYTVRTILAEVHGNSWCRFQIARQKPIILKQHQALPTDAALEAIF